MQNNTSITMLDTSLIVPNKYQPRKTFDDSSLESLANSIKTYGIINPILVRKKEDKYEIIAGERRFRAAKKIGLNEVPVIIKNTDEQQTAELALIENIQRQELNPIEEAKSYEEIMRIGNQTQAELAQKLGKSQSSIANKIRLLSLPQEVQDALTNKKISERHARSLISVEDKEKQLELLNRIIQERLTVKETEQIVNEKETTEEEIKQAISDIMKSLNIKEEEKEDDNMNNGNFFPNFDNNNVANNTSLNMMNMQSMNQQPINPEPEMVMPTMIQQPVEPQQMNQQPQVNNQMFEQFSPVPPLGTNINPMANFGTPQENMVEPIIPTMEPSMINNAPLFSPEPNMVAPNPEPQTSIPMVDEPLFNQNITMPSTEPQTPFVGLQDMTQPEQPMPINPTPYEVPVVNQEPVSQVNTTNNNSIDVLKGLLTSNGYTFKTFSNDTEDCIIIELPRN